MYSISSIRDVINQSINQNITVALDASNLEGDVVAYLKALADDYNYDSDDHTLLHLWGPSQSPWNLTVNLGA